MVNIDVNIKLLAVPPMEKETAEVEYEICVKVKGVCFDTTAMSTSNDFGTSMHTPCI